MDTFFVIFSILRVHGHRPLETTPWIHFFQR